MAKARLSERRPSWVDLSVPDGQRGPERPKSKTLKVKVVETFPVNMDRAAEQRHLCESCGEDHDPGLTCLAAWLEGLKSKARRKGHSFKSRAMEAA